LSVLNNPLISANVGRSFSTVMVVISFGSGSPHNRRTTMTAAIHAALSFLLNIPHTTCAYRSVGHFGAIGAH
jgi:hypothetical protein